LNTLMLCVFLKEVWNYQGWPVFTTTFLTISRLDDY
jgi:hypothetical protein